MFLSFASIPLGGNTVLHQKKYFQPEYRIGSFASDIPRKRAKHHRLPAKNV